MQDEERLQREREREREREGGGRKRDIRGKDRQTVREGQTDSKGREKERQTE